MPAEDSTRTLPKRYRSGVLAGGNWIIDHVKMIDVFPQEEALANILEETSSNGGSPYNLLVDLVKLDAPFALEGVGLVGDDAGGDAILLDCQNRGIDTQQIQKTNRAQTSYTTVMTVKKTGRRTFFHQRGANALLDLEHFDFSKTRARFFHLGYLLLLDRLDRKIGKNEIAAARLLRAARRSGLSTSVDLVSEDSRRFREVVRPVLPEIDVLFLNEFEAERSTGRTVRTKRGAICLAALQKAAADLLRGGVRKLVFIHFAEGAHVSSADGASYVHGSVRVPYSSIVSTVGAGDAFAAGVLLGLHEGEPTQKCLEYGLCSAAACLLDSTASGGMRPLADCMKLGRRHGFRSLA